MITKKFIVNQNSRENSIGKTEGSGSFMLKKDVLLIQLLNKYKTSNSELTDNNETDKSKKFIKCSDNFRLAKRFSNIKMGQSGSSSGLTSNRNSFKNISNDKGENNIKILEDFHLTNELILKNNNKINKNYMKSIQSQRSSQYKFCVHSSELNRITIPSKYKEYCVTSVNSANTSKSPKDKYRKSKSPDTDLAIISKINFKRLSFKPKEINTENLGKLVRYKSLYEDKASRQSKVSILSHQSRNEINQMNIFNNNVISSGASTPVYNHTIGSFSNNVTPFLLTNTRVEQILTTESSSPNGLNLSPSVNGNLVTKESCTQTPVYNRSKIEYKSLTHVPYFQLNENISRSEKYSKRNSCGKSKNNLDAKISNKEIKNYFYNLKGNNILINNQGRNKNFFNNNIKVRLVKLNNKK